MSIFFLAGYVSVEDLFCTLYANRNVNSNFCINRQVEFSKCKVSIIGVAPNKPTVKRSQSKNDDFSGPTRNTPTMKMDYYLNIMHHIVALNCMHVALPPYTQVRINKMTKIPGLIHTGHKNSLLTESHVRSVNEIHEMAAKKPFWM